MLLEQQRAAPGIPAEPRVPVPVPPARLALFR
jgi:hypothetical protein